jgi:hypothetical protein
MKHSRKILATILTMGLGGHLCAANSTAPSADTFHREIQPILETYCYDCHADGANKGGVSFDQFKTNSISQENSDLWWKALKNLRTGLMPPRNKPKPSKEEKETISRWIKGEAFGIDSKNPDPGRSIIRRLNRVEYRNTIHDLLGVDFDTQTEFPPDDTGHGFDTIGEVLTVSPMLMEKYLDAARTIITRTVPTSPGTIPEKIIPGQSFIAGKSNQPAGNGTGPLNLSYYEKAAVSNDAQIEYAGHYQLRLNLSSEEKYVEDVFDYNKCLLKFSVDGQELLSKEFNREGGKQFIFPFELDLKSGTHRLSLELIPTTPGTNQVRALEIRLASVILKGPDDGKHFVIPENYTRYFPRPCPEKKPAKFAYAKELLGDFAAKAYRRPPDQQTVEKLASVAESVYLQPGKTFEAGIAHAMTAVLTSPRFLFREEAIQHDPAHPKTPFVDEYSLASRLSYFLWSSMPDEELFRLAANGKLRENLPAQVRRMFADPRSAAFIENFSGQWLQTRDIEKVAIDARSVLEREEKPDPERDKKRLRLRQLKEKPEPQLSQEEKTELKGLVDSVHHMFHPPAAELTPQLRHAMRLETEKLFSYVVREDRPLEELIECDYIFLNERLAKFYGIDGVTGEKMNLVKLPPDSPRGGVLTAGSVLAVTSNPTRTSAVKRGLFILDNILGTPPPPPPANVPPLEDAAAKNKGHRLSLRETLALHRENALCSSCHNKMDPPGLALENFNAMGMWRTQELGLPVDAAGQLGSGESFKDIRELKHVLATSHRDDFYHCFTEKILTYALGRGIEYYDAETVDEIVARLDRNSGHFSSLLAAVIESAPFQRRRMPVAMADNRPLQNHPKNN